jgi:hypothetical protein
MRSERHIEVVCMKTLTVAEYETLLVDQDWFYQMSEDSWAYRRGSDGMNRLRKHRNDSPKHSELYLKHYKSVEM